MGAMIENSAEPVASRMVLPLHEESAFIQQGEYWMICYHGKTAILKTTRGLNYICYLLHHPGRDVHVSELLANFMRPSTQASGVTAAKRLPNAADPLFAAGFSDAGPVLDPRAKAEYKHRLNDLRQELAEAQRFNDRDRATRAETEIDAIAQQLAAALGLGGRDRRSSSGAERARSAVTKRIKEAVHRVADAIPMMGEHFAATIKTGYFCSYNPAPDCRVVWKF